MSAQIVIEATTTTGNDVGTVTTEIVEVGMIDVATRKNINVVEMIGTKTDQEWTGTKGREIGVRIGSGRGIGKMRSDGVSQRTKETEEDTGSYLIRTVSRLNRTNIPNHRCSRSRSRSPRHERDHERDRHRRRERSPSASSSSSRTSRSSASGSETESREERERRRRRREKKEKRRKEVSSISWELSEPDSQSQKLDS